MFVQLKPESITSAHSASGWCLSGDCELLPPDGETDRDAESTTAGVEMDVERDFGVVAVEGNKSVSKSFQGTREPGVHL